ncbi:MAG: ThiF family adenylyltransferase [Promethearchaeota archaeon]
MSNQNEKNEKDNNGNNLNDSSYMEQFNRNIGFVSREEQEKIRRAKIAILGTGGIGGPAGLELAYAGCENFVLADFDKIEVSNLNRQPYTRKDIDKFKVDALSEKLLAINPRIKIKKFLNLDTDNIDDVLDGVNVAALSLDGPFGSILVARKCREKGIDMIETWAIPYLFAWWFLADPSTPSYEDVYELGTENLSLEELKQNKNLYLHAKLKLVEKLLLIPGIKERYNREPHTVEPMLKGEMPLRSFSPIVWLNSSYLAFEIIFGGILNITKKITAPKMKLFDYYEKKIIEIN